MDMDHELTAISEPLFGFMGDSLIPRGWITLTVDFDEPPCHLRKFMEFLIVDTRSAYHGVLRRPALKDLQGVTSIHHLAMKFPTPGRVAKVAKREGVAPTVMAIHSEPMDVDHKELDDEIILDEGLDPRIIGPDSLASQTEGLEEFSVNSSEPIQELKVERSSKERRIETVLMGEH
ncbi:Uncharacterized protein Adt_27235 [Abeliophyllum distichum]|uniref:DUF4283 domain-containing protein n=1 Tax=Abeliophyllum distichum TaxID=126358 RepID=A0ABD1RT54_9LAMI